jgi:hypothetical protein
MYSKCVKLNKKPGVSKFNISLYLKTILFLLNFLLENQYFWDF